MAKKMSNAIARRWFLHDNDFDRNDDRACYFSVGDVGFWVEKDGSVIEDDETCGGGLPSRRIVEACVRAAKKHLG